MRSASWEAWVRLSENRLVEVALVGAATSLATGNGYTSRPPMSKEELWRPRTLASIRSATTPEPASQLVRSRGE